MSAPLLRSAIVHQLFGEDIGGGALLHAELLAKIPAADLTRRIMNGDYLPVPDESNPDRVWDPSDVVRAHLAARGLSIDGSALPEVPDENVPGRFAVVQDEKKVEDETDLTVAKLAAAAAIAEANAETDVTDEEVADVTAEGSADATPAAPKKKKAPTS